MFSWLSERGFACVTVSQQQIPDWNSAEEGWECCCAGCWTPPAQGVTSPGNSNQPGGCVAIIPDLSLWHSKRAQAGAGASLGHFLGDHLCSQPHREDGGVPAATVAFLPSLGSWKAAAQEGRNCSLGMMA